MSDKREQQGLLDLNQACLYLGIKPSRLRAAIFRREIPHIKIGRLVRFDPRALELWLKARAREERKGVR